MLHKTGVFSYERSGVSRQIIAGLQSFNKELLALIKRSKGMCLVFKGMIVSEDPLGLNSVMLVNYNPDNPISIPEGGNFNMNVPSPVIYTYVR